MCVAVFPLIIMLSCAFSSLLVEITTLLCSSSLVLYSLSQSVCDLYVFFPPAFWFSYLNTVLVSSQTFFCTLSFLYKGQIYYCFCRNEMQGKNKPTLPLPPNSSNKQLLKMGVLNSWEKRMPRSLHHSLRHRLAV